MTIFTVVTIFCSICLVAYWILLLVAILAPKDASPKVTQLILQEDELFGCIIYYNVGDTQLEIKGPPNCVDRNTATTLAFEQLTRELAKL